MTYCLAKIHQLEEMGLTRFKIHQLEHKKGQDMQKSGNSYTKHLARVIYNTKVTDEKTFNTLTHCLSKLTHKAIRTNKTLLVTNTLSLTNRTVLRVIKIMRETEPKVHITVKKLVNIKNKLIKTYADTTTNPPPPDHVTRI